MSVFYCIMVTFILFQSFSFFMETRNIPVLITHLLNDIQNAFFIVSREKKKDEASKDKYNCYISSSAEYYHFHQECIN